MKHISRQLERWHWQGKANIVTLHGAKDPNALHQHDVQAFQATFQQALAQAEPLLFFRAAPPAPTSPSAEQTQPTIFSLQELLSWELPPVRWAIPDILPEGLTLLAGKPKLGKSWLALSTALAIAAGGVALGTQPVTRGEVLYLALEDNARRLQARSKQLLTSMIGIPRGIDFVLSCDDTDDVDDAHGKNDSEVSVSPSPVTATQPCAEAVSMAHERQIIRSPEQREQEDPCSSLATHKSNPGIDNNGLQRNHCNQRHQLPDGGPHSEGQTVCALTGDSTSQTARCTVSRHEQQSCPHHPRAHLVRFDPAGQAWCDQLNCWDCYRLMKIGEALNYPCLIDRGGKLLIEQGRESWSHFVRTQRAFLVVVATEEALIVCNRLRIEIPDLSDEVSRLQTTSPLPPET